MKKLSFLILLLFVIFNSNSAQEWQFKSINLQGMGFVTGIATHPKSNDIYVRTDVGGVYRLDQAINQWLPITDGKIDTYNVEALALNPSNENEVFIVTGNKSNEKLYKSADKGDTFQQLNFPAYVAGNDPWRHDDPRLSIDPNNGGKQMFFASRKNGLLKSEDGGNKWSPISSSVIPAGTTADGGQAFVVFDKNSGNATSNSSTIFVGVAGSGVYKSIDSGLSFTLLPGGPSINYKPVCGAISSDGTLFVTYAAAWDTGDGKVYKFTATGSGIDITPANNVGTSFAGIDVCDTDPKRIVTFQWKFGQTKGIHLSTNGGDSWTTKTCLSANIKDPEWWHTVGATDWNWSGGITFDPQNADKVWFTHGYGVFKTDDINASNPIWDVPMKGLEELVVMQVFSVPEPNSQKLYAAVADVRGFSISDRNQLPATCFEKESFGMTSSIDYCVADVNYLVRVGDNEQYWQSKGFGYVSTNGGQSWNSFASMPANAAHGNIAISASNKRNWVWAPINYSGCGWNVLPHYTMDNGNTWLKCTGISEGNNDCTEEWSASRFLVADRVNGSKFYYYSFKSGENAKFYRSLDGGKSFNQVLNIQLPANYKMKMEAMPGKEGNLFLCARNGSTLLKTEDGGTTWNSISTVDKCFTFGFGKAIGNNPDPTIFMKGVIKGVDGVYFSTDAGKTWTQIMDGNVPGGCLDITGDAKEEYTFYIATGGRGIIYGVNSTTTSSNQIINSNIKNEEKFRVFPNPTNNHFKVSVNGQQSEKLQFFIYNSSGTLIHSEMASVVAGENIFSFNAEELQIAPGMYILKIQTGENSYQQKVCIKV